MIIITIGISGSGKNHLLNSLKEKESLWTDFDLKVVEPDDIRRKKLGDVNNQENGGMIFLIAKSMINRALKHNKDVFFNATNLEWKRIIKFVLDLEKPDKIPVLFIFMTDSVDLNKCKWRVRKDIENGVDRSKVPEDVMDKQHERYMKCYRDSTYSEIGINKCPENWKIYEYFNDLDKLIYFIEEMKNGNN